MEDPTATCTRYGHSLGLRYKSSAGHRRQFRKLKLSSRVQAQAAAERLEEVLQTMLGKARALTMCLKVRPWAIFATWLYWRREKQLPTEATDMLDCSIDHKSEVRKKVILESRALSQHEEESQKPCNVTEAPLRGRVTRTNTTGSGKDVCVSPEKRSRQRGTCWTPFQAASGTR